MMALIGVEEIATRFEVRPTTVRKWQQRYEEFPRPAGREIVHTTSDRHLGIRGTGYIRLLFEENDVLSWAVETGHWDDLVGMPLRSPFDARPRVRYGQTTEIGF
jgi:hypothetical protein